MSEAKNRVPVQMEAVWQEGDERFDATITGISLNGCSVKSSQSAESGELTEFMLKLDSGHWISLQGKIGMVDHPHGFELDFINLSDYNRSVINQIVASRLQQVQPKPQERSTARILIADDDRITLKTLEAIIEAQGHTVVPVSDGMEVFKLLKEDGDFSAVILDMHMPNIEGLDLMRYMKKNPNLRNIPIGIITAEEDPKIWDDSIAIGADIFLPKPFNPQQIQMMLRMLLKRRFIS